MKNISIHRELNTDQIYIYIIIIFLKTYKKKTFVKEGNKKSQKISVKNILPLNHKFPKVLNSLIPRYIDQIHN